MRYCNAIKFSDEEQCQIPQLQVYSPVHMYQANTQASTSASRTTTDDIYIKYSIEGMNSDEWRAATTTTDYDLDGAQKHQQQLAFDNIQLPDWQNTLGQVNQNYGSCQWNSNCLEGGNMAGKCPMSRSAETPECTFAAIVKCSLFARDLSDDWADTDNYFECSEIGMSPSYPNQTDSGVVSSTNHQQISPLVSIQTVRGCTEDHIIIQQLQQDTCDHNKWHGVETAVHVAAGSTRSTHSKVTESCATNPVIAAASTTPTETQSSNSELNSPLKMRRNSESKKKRYICNVPSCNKVYTTRYNLQVHSRKHTGERPFVCEWTVCGRRFYRNKDLQSHSSIHTGEKCFQCTICLRKFRLKDYLSQHLKRHVSK